MFESVLVCVSQRKEEEGKACGAGPESPHADDASTGTEGCRRRPRDAFRLLPSASLANWPSVYANLMTVCRNDRRLWESSPRNSRNPGSFFCSIFAVLMTAAAPAATLCVCPSAESRRRWLRANWVTEGRQSAGPTGLPASHGSSGGKAVMSLLVLTTSPLLPRPPLLSSPRVTGLLLKWI